jgi:hypothetical protein
LVFIDEKIRDIIDGRAARGAPVSEGHSKRLMDSDFVNK